VVVAACAALHCPGRLQCVVISYDLENLPDIQSPCYLQKEVEHFYISHGYILPMYHKFYWMGLNSSGMIFPNFTWLTPDVNSQAYLADYSHWGTGQPANDETKMCTGGHANMSYDEAWGWANDECQLPYIFMCRIMRKRPCLLC
jgi:hypothetical protein